MIELKCPNCKCALEVDDGFRGGVCRCFKCGTLMTVPDDAGQSPAESLSQATPAEAEGPVESPRSARTYTTKSGRTLRLSQAQIKKAPVARKPRKSIRVAVLSGTIALTILLVGGVGTLAYMLFRPPPVEAEVDPYEGLYDIEHNPYTWSEPNFMGLPVGKTTVMLIDGTGAMRDQIDFIKKAVVRSAATLKADHKAQVIFWRESGPWVYPGQITSAGSLDAKALEAAMDDISAGGAATPDAAIQKALTSNPDQITLVARSLTDASAAKAWGEKLKSAKVRLVIIHLDGSESSPDSAAWKEAAESTQGFYATLSSSRLRRWYEEYNQTREETAASKP